MNHNFPWCYDQTKFFHQSIYMLVGWLQKTRLCNSTEPVVKLPFCLFFAFGIISLRLNDNPKPRSVQKERAPREVFIFWSSKQEKRKSQSQSRTQWVRFLFVFLSFSLVACLFILCVCLLLFSLISAGSDCCVVLVPVKRELQWWL